MLLKERFMWALAGTAVAVTFLAPPSTHAQQACAGSTVVYDMTGPTCPNGDERCNFSTGFHFYRPAGGPGTPLLLMTTGYDLNTYRVTQLDATTRAWQSVQTTVFNFANQFRSLNRILLEVDVDPETGLGIAPYQDKPVRIFQITAQNTVEELWRNPYDGTYPNTGTTGTIFSLPTASGKRHFAAWVNNASLEIFEVLVGSPTQLVSRHNTGVEFLKVVAKRGNPTYLYGVVAATRLIKVYRVQLDAGGNLEVTQTFTLTPYSKTTDGLDAFAGLALDPTTGRLYSSVHKVVGSPKTYVECWETGSNPAQPTYRSRLLLPSAKLSRTLAARGGWVIATSTDPNVFFNHPLSFHNPDAPVVVNTWPDFPQPVGDTRRRVGPNGAALVHDPSNNIGVAFADVEWAALAWLNPACANATPVAGVGVTRQGNSGTPTCTPGNVAAHGFPGDSFAIKDESTGSNYTVSEVKVVGVDSHNASYQWLATPPPPPGGTVSWPGSETLPLWGRFQVSLKILRQDQTTDTATKEVYLCNQPVPRATVVATRPPGGNWTPCTTCTWLRGDSLKLSAAGSDGYPNLPETSWQVEHSESSQGPFAPVPAQDGQVVNWEVANGELQLHLLRQGFYRATASVVYAFASQPFEALSPVLPSAAVAAAIRVEQPQGTVIPVGGTVRSTSPVYLTATTQLASGWQVISYSWTVVEHPGGPTVASGSTAELTISSGLHNGKTYRASLTVVGSDGFQQENVTATRDFAVQDVAGDFTWSPETPAVGQEVTFTPTGLSSGITKLAWNLGDPLCDGTGPRVEVSCLFRSCNLIQKFANQGPRTVTLEVLMGGTWYQVASKPVTVAPGVCQTCTPATAPTLLAPAEGATVNPGQPVSFLWSAASGTAPITYTLTASSGLGSGSCTTTDTTSCAITFNMPGTYTWSVRATNSCNPTGATSTTRTVTVQSSSCNPPAAPSLSAPAADEQLPSGNVTFSWQPVAGATSYAVQIRRLGSHAGSCTPDPPTGTSCTASLNDAGIYTWTVSAANSCGSTSSAERTFSIASACGSLGAPSLDFPLDNATVSGAAVTLRWSAPTQGQAPFTYDVYVDGFRRAEGLTGLETSVPNLAAGSHTWYVVAKDHCNQTAQSPSRRFVVSSCTVSLPDPNFNWAPRGEDPYFPNQMQPFEGQEVTFEYTGTGGPPEHYRWYDFQQSPPKVVEGPNLSQVTHTWTKVHDKVYQDMNVRLVVRNCAGAAPELLKQVPVYKDVRGVKAAFTTHGPAAAGQPVKFVASASRAEGNPTRFEWDFGDGSPKQTVETPQVEHTYSCGRTYQVTLKAWRGDVASAPFTKAVAVGGRPCAPLALVVPDVAIEVASRYALWRSELVLFNPEELALTAQLRARTRDHQEFTGQLTIPPRGAANLDDLRGVLKDGQGGVLPDNVTVTLWVEALQGNRLPLVGARTYTEPSGGGSYGQAVPVYPLHPPETTATTLWVVGPQHNGTANGFRSNLTVINPAGTGWGPAKGMTLTLYDNTGQTYTKRLTAFAPRQYNRYDPLTALFNLDKEVDLGKFSLKVEVDAGVQALVVCSVNDNLTNDSFALLAVPDVN